MMEDVIVCYRMTACVKRDSTLNENSLYGPSVPI